MRSKDPVRFQKRALLEWAMVVFREEGPKLEPRVARVQDGELQEALLDRSIRLRGVAEAAAIVLRTVGDEDLVAALSPQKDRPGVKLDAAWAAALDIRSRAGHRSLVMLGARAKGTSVTYWHRGLPLDLVAHVGDWAAPGYAVDPWLETQLAAAGVPGAVAPAPAAVFTVNGGT